MPSCRLTIPTDRAETLYTWLSLAGLGLGVFFGLQANRMALDRYLALGWRPAERPAFRQR